MICLGLGSRLGSLELSASNNKKKDSLWELVGLAPNSIFDCLRPLASNKRLVLPEAGGLVPKEKPVDAAVAGAEAGAAPVDPKVRPPAAGVAAAAAPVPKLNTMTLKLCSSFRE